jgi:hypothetical protein
MGRKLTVCGLGGVLKKPTTLDNLINTITIRLEKEIVFVLPMF